MCIVNHHDRAILFGKIAEPGQRPDVTVHGKNAVADEQLAARLVFHTGQLGFGVSNVLVLENENLGAGKASAVNDRRMIELVGDDEIFFSENR